MRPANLSLEESLSDSPPAAVHSAADSRLRRMIDVYFDFIWRSLRRLGIPADTVDDAAQGVFWIAARNLAQIAPESERSYLFGTAVRVAADARRVRARVREVSGDREIESAVHPTPSPDELLDQKRAREILDSLLEEMAMDLRTVLVLVEGEGLSGPEIASLLGLPEGTVNSRLRRAREALTRGVARIAKRASEERGFES
jgi:RNA polymerase sigma-70 factor (ECF subfamily)